MAASMQDGRNYQKELNTALDYLLVLSKQDPKDLQKKLYESFSALAYLAVEGKDAGFKEGWAAELKDRHDSPLFSKEEADIVETVTRNTVKPIFEIKHEQKGGNPSLTPMTSKTGMLQKDMSLVGAINPEDLSIDTAYWKVKNFLEGLDKQAHDLSREFGPFRFFYETSIDPKFPLPVPIPTPPFVTVIMIPIPARSIPVVIGALVDGIRLIFSVGANVAGIDPKTSDLARKILSVVMSLIDLFKGEWKHALLSFAGYYGQYPLIAGLVGKVFLNVFGLIAPDLQDRLIFDMFQSTKSMFMGGFLWAFATLSPDFVRKLARIQFDKLKELADNSNEQVTKIQESMQKSVGPAGLKIEFNQIPEDAVPSFDDIQNLQSIARQPAIYCSKEFQEAIAPLRLIPPARFLLEMMSIPTSEKSVEMECRGMAGVSLDKTVDQLISPKVTVDPDSPMGKDLGVQDPTKVVMPEAASEASSTSAHASEASSTSAHASEASSTSAHASEASGTSAHASEASKKEVHAKKKPIAKKGGSRRRKTRRRSSSFL